MVQDLWDVYTTTQVSIRRNFCQEVGTKLLNLERERVRVRERDFAASSSSFSSSYEDN